MKRAKICFFGKKINFGKERNVGIVDGLFDDN